jgi:hypothetical protein
MISNLSNVPVAGSLATKNKITYLYRYAGLAAITSGTIGIIDIAALAAYLLLRNSNEITGTLMSKIHDTVVIFQFLLMVPVVFGFRQLSRQQPPGIGKATLITGVTAICLVVLFLSVIFPKIVSEILYMIPQGIFGVCLAIINWRLKGVFSRGLRWFGIIVGLGLTLVGVFPIGFAIFINTAAIQIPPPPPIDFPITPANMILHQILWAGSVLGVLCLPFWTILSGRRLLRARQ